MKNNNGKLLKNEKRNLGTNESGNTIIPKLTECSKSRFKEEVHSDKCQPQETKVANKQPNFTPRGTKKGTKPKVGRRKGITKIRQEINETDTKKDDKKDQ